MRTQDESPNEAATAVRQRIGEELRSHRKARHWTLRELSQKSNVSLGYLSEIERATKEPTLATLLAVAQALDLHFVVGFREKLR